MVPYRDLYPRLCITLLAAHWLVSFGEPETFFELLLMPGYYRSLLWSWLMAFLVVSIVRWVTVQLDGRFGWKEHILVRAVLQVFMGVGALGIVAFLLAAVYFHLHGINILKTPYLSLDFPLILLMLIVINLYYFGYHIYVSWREGGGKYPGGTGRYKQVVIVRQGSKNIPVNVRDIAYFHRSGGENFLRTHEGVDHLVGDALDHIENWVDPRQYFRANRQFIAAFVACEGFENIENDKLELFVAPRFNERVVISQKKAAAFREWLERRYRV